MNDVQAEGDMATDATIRLLMLEDAATDAELALRQLRRDGLKVDARRVETREDFIAELARAKPDLILSDYSLPQFDGFSALGVAREWAPDVPFIFLSGTIGEETAIEALKRGAIDYVLKTNLNRLGPAVRRALDEAHTRTAHLHAESRFRDLIEYAPHAIVVLNQRGEIEIVNAQLESLFGYRRDELVGMKSETLIPAQFDEWFKRLAHDRQQQEGNAPRTLSFEATASRRDRTEFPAEISLSPLKTEDGLWISGVIRDISERKEQESRITRLSRIHTVLAGINNAIVRIRDRQRFLDEVCRIAVEDGQFAAAWIGMLNPENLRIKPVAWAGIGNEFLKNLEVSMDERLEIGHGPSGTALRTRCGSVIHDIETDEHAAPWRASLMERGYRSACAMPLLIEGRPIGSLVLYARQKHVFGEDDLRLLSMVAADISFALDHFRKEEQLNYLAYFDPLTGLPNRGLFQDRLAQLIASEADRERDSIAVVFLDLDRFRNINESFGRVATDDLLREVAHRLQGVLPDPGFLARIHADCFAFALKDVKSEADVIALLERKIAPILGEPVGALDKDVHISATCGIVLYPADGRDVDILLRNAEAALKNAKAAKVPYLFYTAAMNARAAEKLSIENRLRRALEQEQFVLHYQPKVDLATDKIVGLEALIRWQEPDGELVLPEKFIHILEETGLIVEVGYWVIARAYRQSREWAERGVEPPRIAVNVSQLQIRQKDFVRHILLMLGVAEPGALELEITESLFMQGDDQDAARAKLASLRERGITMAIDDFGTGYSSLSYIAHLPIDTLKIDRSFIADMATSADHMAIVSTIISLAHALKLKVVAEGVETVEQCGLLKSLDCDQIQGYLYGRTVPPEEIEARLMLQQAA
jgi:PAS domain S-box-containing protein/diguanylate cyclase (GGDEF)-like protein